MALETVSINKEINECGHKAFSTALLITRDREHSLIWQVHKVSNVTNHKPHSDFAKPALQNKSLDGQAMAWLWTWKTAPLNK